MTMPATPAIQRTFLPETLLISAAYRIRCLPKTQPSIMIASHGTTGYLITISLFPYVATVKAEMIDEFPGGDQTKEVTISPTTIHPTDSVMSSQLGSRRSGTMQIIEIPIASRT